MAQYDFSVGPATLPEIVATRLTQILISHQEFSLSPGRPAYALLYRETVERLRVYLGVPDNYRIFLMRGSVDEQYAAVPLNLLKGEKKADYIVSGSSSVRAVNEAKHYGDIEIAASSSGAGFTFVPATSRDSFRPDAAYVHICYSNAHHGTQFPYVPETGDIPLVAQMNACLGLETVRISDFGLLYADTQNNLGIPGMTIVIIREDLLGSPLSVTPSVLDYSLIADLSEPQSAPSFLNLYATSYMVDWLTENGGLSAMSLCAKEKSSLLYDYLDHQTYYVVPVDKASRATFSVAFQIEDPEMNIRFIKEATQADLIGLDAHKTTGGMRACLFNSLPQAAVEHLVTFMKQFAANNPLDPD